MGTESIKRKAMNVTRQIARPVIVAAIAGGVTYSVCDNLHSDEVAALKEEIAQLQKTAQEAKVTQRVSEQMEDIAFQQKIISDKERELAEEHKKIADMERGKAEIERGLAQAAEKKALASAEEAQQMRLLADQQKEEALRNMKAAELARAQTDTLYYRSLGASLAQSSLSFGTNVNNTSRLLAYSSWYFTSQYGGNVYDENIFKALLFSSKNVERVHSDMKGNVRAIHTIGNNGQRWALGVTDFGEIFCYNTNREHLHYSFPESIFRDLAIIDDTRFATITYNGEVTIFEYSPSAVSTPTILKSTKLLSGQWNKITTTNEDGILLCLSSDNVAWLDTNTMTVIASQPVEGTPTTIGKENDIIHIFGKNGAHYISEKSGVIASMPLSKIGVRVTAFHYLKKHKMKVIGTEHGTIYIINDKGEIEHTLTGHNGAITHLGSTGNYLVSTSYDCNLRYWCIEENASSIVSNFEVSFDKWPLTFDIDDTENTIWVGNSEGNINRYGIEPNINAASVQSLLRQDFTKKEWDYYIGPFVPYRSFMRKEDESKKGGAQ